MRNRRPLPSPSVHTNSLRRKLTLHPIPRPAHVYTRPRYCTCTVPWYSTVHRAHARHDTTSDAIPRPRRPHPSPRATPRARVRRPHPASTVTPARAPLGTHLNAPQVPRTHACTRPRARLAPRQHPPAAMKLRALSTAVRAWRQSPPAVPLFATRTPRKAPAADAARLPPVLMVHGVLASAATYRSLVRRPDFGTFSTCCLRVTRRKGHGSSR